MPIATNNLGIDYVALITFLWIIAGIDYQTRMKASLSSDEVQHNVLLIRFVFIVLGLMAAFRSLDITNDTNAYYKMYSAIRAFGPQGVSRIEKGYVYLNYIVSLVFKDNDSGFHALQILTAVFSYWSVERYIEKRSKTYGICILAFYFLLNGNFMSAMRQSIAIAIVLLALEWLDNKRYILYILAVFLAAQFHSTAWVALFFIFLYNRKFNKYLLILIISVSVGAMIINVPSLIAPMLNYGTIYLVTEVGNRADTLVMSVMYIMLLGLHLLAPEHFYESEDEVYQEDGPNNSLYIYSIGLTLAFTILSMRAPAISRFTGYTMIVGLPYISNTLEEIDNGRESFLIKVGFCSAIWAYSLIALIYRPEWQHLWPYHFFWTN